MKQLPEQTTLIVYDIYGRVLEQKVLSEGSHETELNTSKYQTGMYLVQLVAEHRLIAQSKLLILE